MWRQMVGTAADATVRHRSESADRLVRFQSYDAFQEARIFFAYRPLMYLGVFFDLVFIPGDYIKHGLSFAFFYLAFSRAMAAVFTLIIVYVTYSERFCRHRGLWIILFGNTSLMFLLSAYIYFDTRVFYIGYTWVYYMLSTIIISPILSNRAFLIVHYTVAFIVMGMMVHAGVNREDIGIFALFILPVLVYLWAVVAAYRREGRRSYALAYQNHIYMVLDTLSQLLNRREFYLRAIDAWQFAQKNGTPIFFIMLDIDHFKNVNDTYGHE